MTTPKLCRHRSKSLGYVTLDGKEHYLGHWPASSRRAPPSVQAAYEDIIGRWLANGRRLPDAEPAPEVTVNDVCLAFLKYAIGHYAEQVGRTVSEVAGIKDACRVIRERKFGPAPAVEFGPKALKDVRAAMVAKGWSRNYVNKQVNRLKRMFRWAVAEEMVPPSVVHGLSAVPAIRKGEPGVRETPKVKPAPDADVEAALPFMPLAVAAMVRVQVTSGMRPYEVCVLRGRDIDRTGDVWVFRPPGHKKDHLDHDRIVYLGPKAQAVLLPWLCENPDDYLFSPVREREKLYARLRKHRKTKVQPSQVCRKRKKPSKLPGRHYSPDSYRQAVAKACGKAGVPVWAPNRLRHSAATEFRREFGIEVTRVLLGHSHLSTSEIYAEADSAAAIAAAAKAG